jgi:hypothetical protein
MATIKVKRGTRSEINTAASASGLNQGELYLITDEDVLAVGTSSSTYEDVNSAGLTNLVTDVTGTLPIANGGTGLTALGSAGQVLKVNSAGNALEYATDNTGAASGADPVVMAIALG